MTHTPEEIAEQARMYRWLRDTNNDSTIRSDDREADERVPMLFFLVDHRQASMTFQSLWGESFDAAIRAAMARTPAAS